MPSDDPLARVSAEDPASVAINVTVDCACKVEPPCSCPPAQAGPGRAEKAGVTVIKISAGAGYERSGCENAVR